MRKLTTHTERRLVIKVALICLLMQGCAAAMPIAGATGTARSEYRFEQLEQRVLELEKIIDYLIEE